MIVDVGLGSGVDAHADVAAEGIRVAEIALGEFLIDDADFGRPRHRDR